MAEAKKAVSVFICLGTMAAGILTIIGFMHEREIWKRYPGWIRTLRTPIPSIAVVRETFSESFHTFLHQNSHLSISLVVLPLLRSSRFLYSDVDFDVFDNTA